MYLDSINVVITERIIAMVVKYTVTAVYLASFSPFTFTLRMLNAK